MPDKGLRWKCTLLKASGPRKVLSMLWYNRLEGESSWNIYQSEPGTVKSCEISGVVQPPVLTAIELAREARVAANHAFLAGLEHLPARLRLASSGDILGPRDPLVVAAARKLAYKAGFARSQAQAMLPLHSIVISWHASPATLRSPYSTSSFNWMRAWPTGLHVCLR